mmetsp:Transcript_5586/g.13000  ORF Transcript_5586/g.13000 Transcript_5586/m.13000 type:complete len:224 (-) Transcript_5586:68-739(-)
MIAEERSSKDDQVAAGGVLLHRLDMILLPFHTSIHHNCMSWPFCLIATCSSFIEMLHDRRIHRVFADNVGHNSFIEVPERVLNCRLPPLLVELSQLLAMAELEVPVAVWAQEAPASERSEERVEGGQLLLALGRPLRLLLLLLHMVSILLLRHLARHDALELLPVLVLHLHKIRSVRRSWYIVRDDGVLDVGHFCSRFFIALGVCWCCTQARLRCKEADRETN